MATKDHEDFRARLWHYALKDEKSPLNLYNKLLVEAEEKLDPANNFKIDDHPDKDWLRST